MKKFATLIAALVMCFALCISVSAYSASEVLNTSNAPTGTTEAAYGKATVTAEVYPAGTAFSAGKDVPGKYFSEFQVYDSANNYVGYYFSSPAFTLPDDGKVYLLQVFDGSSFTYEDVYVTAAAAEPEVPTDPYGNYVVESGYSMTYFYSAYSERAVSVIREGEYEEYLIPLNIKSGTNFGFGGMEGFCAPIPFYKATYDAAAGTISDMELIPLDFQTDSYGYTLEMNIDDVVRAAEGVEGNAIVFSGSSARMDELNSDIYYALFLVQVDGQKPAAPAPAPVESFTDVAKEDTFYDAIAYVTKKGLMSGVSETAFERKTSVSHKEIFASLEQTGADTAAAKAWATEQKLDDAAAATREDVITMLWIANGKKDADESVLAKFADAATISAESRIAMAWAVETGLIQGYANGHLGAQVQLTRGAMAAILYRAAV